MVPDQIEREILIEAPVAKVWAAVTKAEHVGTWFGNAGATVELRPGGDFSCTWRDGENLVTVHGLVEKVDEPHLFSFRWARPPGTRPTVENTTLVEFRLRGEGAATRLKVVESGFRGLPKSDEDKLTQATQNTEGWRRELAKLADYAPTLR